MTTPTSGQISLSQIRDVFNGAGQVSFSECQSGGSLAADTVTSTPSGTVPNTGSQGTFSDFYSPLTGVLAGRFDGATYDSTYEPWYNVSNFADGSSSTYAYHEGDDTFTDTYGWINFYNWNPRAKLPTDCTITNLKQEYAIAWSNTGGTDHGYATYMELQIHQDAVYENNYLTPSTIGTNGNIDWFTLLDGALNSFDNVVPNADCITALTSTTSTAGDFRLYARVNLFTNPPDVPYTDSSVTYSKRWMDQKTTVTFTYA